MEYDFERATRNMMTSENRLCRTYTAKFHECRPDGRIHFHVMVRNLQEMAVAHAEVLGCGTAMLNQSGHYWVLSNIRIKATALPAYADKFKITTWPSTKNRLLAQREFIVSGAGDAPLLKAASEWLIMNVNTRTPVKLTRLGLHIPESDETVFDAKLKRLKPLPSGTPVLQFPVMHSYLDTNGHVNNTEYVRWAIDALHLIADGTPAIDTLQVTYLSEVFEKNQVAIMADSDPKTGEWRITGTNLSFQKPSFIARITLQDTSG